jgi:hypothetical protein
MREIKKDTRAFDRMVAQEKTYKSLAEDLKQYGENLNERTVYRYITHKCVPSKSTKKAIAKALNCSVMEIY